MALTILFSSASLARYKSNFFTVWREGEIRKFAEDHLGDHVPTELRRLREQLASRLQWLENARPSQAHHRHIRDAKALAAIIGDAATTRRVQQLTDSILEMKMKTKTKMKMKMKNMRTDRLTGSRNPRAGRVMDGTDEKNSGKGKGDGDGEGDEANHLLAGLSESSSSGSSTQSTPSSRSTSPASSAAIAVNLHSEFKHTNSGSVGPAEVPPRIIGRTRGRPHILREKRASKSITQT